MEQAKKTLYTVYERSSLGTESFTETNFLAFQNVNPFNASLTMWIN